MTEEGAAENQGKTAVKLLQGYIWHPREEQLELSAYLPSRLDPDIHLLWDAIPQAPFTFFDDGTLTATQQFYQFTVLRLLEAGREHDPGTLVPWLAAILQERLERTPPGVGWQVMEDLREIG